MCQPVHIVADPPARISVNSHFQIGRNSEIAKESGMATDRGSEEERKTALSVVALPWQAVSISLEAHQIDSQPIRIRLPADAIYRQVDISGCYANLEISPSDRLESLILGFLKGSLLIVIAAVVICAAYWIGLSISCWLTGGVTDESVQSEITAVFIGLFGASLLLGSLAYFASARELAIFAIALWLICAIHVRFAIPARMLAGMLPALPALMLSFWPIFLVGGDFLGLYQTDMFEYSTLVSFLMKNSLFGIQALQDAQHSGLITSGAGFSWRSIDSVMAATLGSLFGIHARSALTLTAITFYLIYICATLLVLESLKAPQALKVLGVAVASLAPGLNTLYTAGYFSHFIFACIMPATIVLTNTFNTCLAQRDFGNRVYWPILAAWLLAVAMGMAVYPYFMVITLAGVGIFLLWHQRGQLKYAVAAGLAAATAVLLATNVNCLSLLGYFKTKQFQGALDSLAQHTLMSGMTSQMFVQFLLGGRAYTARPADINQFKEALFVSMPALQPAYLDSSVWFYAYFILAVATCGIALRSARTSKTLQVVFCVAAIWLAVFLWFYSQDRHYIYLKAGWTGSTILPLLSLALAKPRALPPAMGAAMLILLSLSWIAANAIDKYPYAANEYSAFAKRSHVALVHDIKLIDEALNQYADAHPRGEVAYRYGDEDLRGTDRDRVLFAHARVTERSLGLINNKAKGILIPDEPSKSAGLLITIGRDLPQARNSGIVSVTHGVNTSIYRRGE